MIADSAESVNAVERTMALAGGRIRSERTRQGLTLKEIAARTGVSVSMLSMLERGVASASVGTLVSVASALGIHMSDLFGSPDAATASPVTRFQDQPTVTTAEGTTRRVAHQDAAAGVELAVNTYEPGSASGPRQTHHEGREFGMVVSGSLRIELEGAVHDLHEGDVIAYNSARPHRIVNTTKRTCVAVWINLDAD